MRLLTRSVSGLLLWLMLASRAGAQFDQYTTPGGPEGRPIDRKGELAKEVQDARFRLGPLRVAPTAGLKDVAYVKNLVGAAGGGQPTDFTATAGAGARAYLPTGPQVTWTAYALPEYVWWQKETARRRLNGLYGAGFNGFWNRLTVLAAAGSDARQQVLTAEVPSLTNARVDHARASVELRLSGPLSTFVSGSVERQKSLTNHSRQAQDPLADLLALLDREERVERAGVRWRPGGGWVVGLGAEHSDVSFSGHGPGAIDRSNSGTAPVLEVTREHGRLFFQADVAQRFLRGKQGSSFVKFDKTTGHATVAFELTRTLEVFVYANRNLVYSVLTNYSYFDDLRHGASLHLKLGRRAAANVFGETGTLGYTAITPGTPRRADDLTAFGAGLSVQLLRRVAANLQGSRTRFTSNLPGAGRSLTTLGLSVTLGGPPTGTGLAGPAL
jgi:hypothetical protein